MAIYLGNQEVAFTSMAPLKSVVLRPDAELISTYSLNHLVASDDGITFPDYATTNVVLIEPVTLGTITPDYDNYDYFIEEKILTVPQYNTNSIIRGRQEYGCTVSCFQICRYPSSIFSAIAGNATVSAASFAVTNSTMSRHIYYSSETTLTAYTAVTYGINQTIQAPTADANSITIIAPSTTIRGSVAYFSRTYFEALTDCRRQYIIRVYRASRSISDVHGWSAVSSMDSLLSDINNNNLILR